MRNPGKHGRLTHVRGQLFACGMFGACSDGVLSPRTPPPIVGPADRSDIATTSSAVHRPQDRRVGMIPPTSTQWDFHIDREGPEQGLIDRVVQPPHPSGSHLSILQSFSKELSSGQLSKAALRVLRQVAQDSDEGRKFIIHELGLASMLLLALSPGDQEEQSEASEISEEALSVIAVLSEHEDVRALVSKPQILPALSRHLNGPGMGCRTSAITVLEQISMDEGFIVQVGAIYGIMEGIVKLLGEDKHPSVVKCAIKTLMALCLAEENRSRAVAAGAVAALLHILPDTREVSAERALATLNLLCTTSEGQRAMREHALAIPILLNMILKVSDRGSEYAAGTLCALCGLESDIQVLKVALQAGALTQMLLLLQSDCTSRARRKALQLLKVLHRVWGVGDSCGDVQDTSNECEAIIRDDANW